MDLVESERIENGGGGEVALHLIDEHESEFVGGGEAGGAEDVSCSFVDDGAGCCGFNCFDVSEGCVVAEHFCRINIQVVQGWE